MNLRATLISAALLSLAAPAFAAAPATSFNLVAPGGKSIGNASYTISKDKNGFHVVSKFQYHLGISSEVMGETVGNTHTASAVNFNEGQFSEDFKVSEEGSFLSGYMQNSTNQMIMSFQPNKAGTTVTVNQVQGGASQAHDVPIPKPVFLVVPDFDPASLQLFLTTALAHPHDDKTYLFIVPAGSNLRGKDQAAYVVLQLAPDTPSGTLDGKPVTLRHYLLGYHTGKPSDLYIDDAGDLMQADITPLKISYIRVKFALTPSTTAK